MDGGHAICTSDRLAGLALDKDMHRLLAAGLCDGVFDKGTRMQGKNRADGRVQRADGAKLCLVLTEPVEVETAQIHQDHALAFRTVRPPLKARVFEILDDQILMDLKGGDREPKLCLASMRLIKIKEGKTDLVPGLEGVTGGRVVDIKFRAARLIGCLAQGGKPDGTI